MPITREELERRNQELNAARAKEAELRAQLQDANNSIKGSQAILKDDVRSIREDSSLTDAQKQEKIARAQAEAKEKQKSLEAQKQDLESEIKKQAADVKDQESLVKSAQADVDRQQQSQSGSDNARRSAGKNAPAAGSPRSTPCPPCQSIADKISDTHNNYQNQLVPSYEASRRALGNAADDVDQTSKDILSFQDILERAKTALQAGREVLSGRPGPNSDLQRNLDRYRSEVQSATAALKQLSRLMGQQVEAMKSLNKEVDEKFTALDNVAFTINNLLDSLTKCEQSQCPPGVSAQKSSDAKKEKEKDTASPEPETPSLPSNLTFNLDLPQAPAAATPPAAEPAIPTTLTLNVPTAASGASAVPVLPSPSPFITSFGSGLNVTQNQNQGDSGLGSGVAGIGSTS